MAEFIKGSTANEVWKKVANMLLEQNVTLGGRTGEVYELLHTFISIEEPRQKWIYDRIPPISIGYALAEVVWIMNGENRADVINFWNPSLEKYAGKSDLYHGAYGKRIFSHFGFDQMEKAYEALYNIPESRQVVVQIYDVKVDFPLEKGKPRNDDIPCNICSLLKIRDSKLEWSQIMRSNDVLLGLPYNIVQFTSLQEILAGWLGLEVGTYNHYSDSLHLYERDISKIGIGKEKEIVNTESISLSKIESKKIFVEIYNRMKMLTNQNISENDIFSLANLKSEYNAYNNIMLIIAAYVAQKGKNYDLVKELMSTCSNNLYTEMWNRWVNK